MEAVPEGEEVDGEHDGDEEEVHYVFRERRGSRVWGCGGSAPFVLSVEMTSHVRLCFIMPQINCSITIYSYFS